MDFFSTLDEYITVDYEAISKLLENYRNEDFVLNLLFLGDMKLNQKPEEKVELLLIAIKAFLAFVKMSEEETISRHALRIRAICADYSENSKDISELFIYIYDIVANTVLDKTIDPFARYMVRSVIYLLIWNKRWIKMDRRSITIVDDTDITPVCNKIYEYILLYLFLLEKYIHKIVKRDYICRVDLGSEIEWVCDCPSNPIEKYLLSNRDNYTVGEKSSLSFILQMSEYQEIVNKIYDLDRIVDELEYEYPHDQILSLTGSLMPDPYPMDEIIAAVIVQRFFARSKLTNYIRD